MFKLPINRHLVKYGLLSIVFMLTAPFSIAAGVSDEPMYKEAIEKIAKQDWQGAHRLFKSLQENYPDDPTVLNNLAVIAVHLNQFELAAELLEHAMLSHPKLAISYKNLQSLYNYQAVLEYKKALSLDTLKLSAPKLNFVGIPGQVTGPDVDKKPPSEIVLSQEEIKKPLVEETQPEPSASPTDDKKQIEAHLRQWAEAWSRQDLAGYFNSYIKDYRPRSGAAHQRWRKLREDRIVKPQFIKVRVSKLAIKKQDGDNAKLRFTQYYQSNLLKSTVTKELELLKTDAGWRIKSERVVNTR